MERTKVVLVRDWAQHLRSLGIQASTNSLSLSFSLSLILSLHLHVHIATFVASGEEYLSISTLILNPMDNESESQKTEITAGGHLMWEGLWLLQN